MASGNFKVKIILLITRKLKFLKNSFRGLGKVITFN